MFTVKLMNKISDVIYESLGKATYSISEDAQTPDAVLVRSGDMHSVDVPGSLLAVARAGAGVNNIPVADYTKRGIAVFNTPGANANAVAELVMLGILMSGRRVYEGIRWAEGLKGEPNVPALVEKGKGQFVGPELRGKTLGVIGLGAIGVKVANAAANGLCMEVIGSDPYMSLEHAWSLSRAVKRASSLSELLSVSDFVSIHVPLTDATRAMFDATLLRQMKKGAHLLNFSRAELVDAEAVKSAIAEGQLQNYVTDFPTEALLCEKGVLSIPHLGASTPESEENCAQMAAEALRDYLEKGIIKNSVNLPDIAPDAPEGSHVMVIHENAPGLVSEISGLIAAKGINIASMVNKSRGDVAVTVLDLAAMPDASLLPEINAIPRVIRTRKIGA